MKRIMFCSKCGNRIWENSARYSSSKFCPDCGNEFEVEEIDSNAVTSSPAVSNSQRSSYAGIFVVCFIIGLVIFQTPIGLRIPIEFIQNISCENNVDVCLEWVYYGKPTFFDDGYIQHILNLLLGNILELFIVLFMSPFVGCGISGAGDIFGLNLNSICSVYTALFFPFVIFEVIHKLWTGWWWPHKK